MPITEEVVMQRRTNGSDFQEQLDAIDAELTKFDNGVRTYVFHMLGTYVTILCNWLIF